MGPIVSIICQANNCSPQIADELQGQRAEFVKYAVSSQVFWRVSDSAPLHQQAWVAAGDPNIVDDGSKKRRERGFYSIITHVRRWPRLSGGSHRRSDAGGRSFILVGLEGLRSHIGRVETRRAAAVDVASVRCDPRRENGDMLS